MSRPAAPLGAVVALASHELQLTARRGENILATIAIPAGALVFFSTVAKVPGVAGPAVDYMLPGSLALAVIASGLVSLGIVTAFERSYGVLKRLGGAPLPAWGLVAAKLAAVLALEVLQVGILVTVATVLGWRPSAGLSPGLVVVALVLGTITFAGLGMLLAGTLRAEATLAIANGLFLVLIMIGGVILPLDRLPSPIAAVAGVLPASALAELFRAGLAGGADTTGPVIVLAIWGIAAAGVAIRTFRWE